MADNKGKAFEQKFKEDARKSFPNAFIYRFPDQQSGYAGGMAQNISDFLVFTSGILFLLECKTRAGASISLKEITQYEKLLASSQFENVRCGVIIWFYEKEYGIIYLPVSTITKLLKDGEKSFGIRHLNNEKYPSYILPSVKKRVFYETDYRPLLEIDV